MNQLVFGAICLLILPYLTAGTNCGTSPARHCGQDDSECVQGKCKCSEGTVGNGYLGCYSKTEVTTCILVNDPILKTARNERVDLPVPCRYHALEYKNKFQTDSDGEWGVITTVSGFNERIKGKIYVKGFDVNLQYMQMSTGATGDVRVRVKGSYVEGSYEYERAILQPDSLVWAPITSSSVEVEGLPFNERFITANIDDENKRLELIVPFNYLKIFFRPANPILGVNQVYVPGLSVGVTETDPALVDWDDLDDTTMCLTPEGNNRPDAAAVAADLHLSTENAFTFLAFLHTDNQTFPGSSKECVEVAKVIQACTDEESREEAMDACSFILQSPHFVSCWEFSGAGVDSDLCLELFKVCMDAFCTKDVDSCVSIRTQITEHTCAKHAGPLLVEHDCGFEGHEGEDH